MIERAGLQDGIVIEKNDIIAGTAAGRFVHRAHKTRVFRQDRRNCSVHARQQISGSVGGSAIDDNEFDVFPHRCGFFHGPQARVTEVSLVMQHDNDAHTYAIRRGDGYASAGLEKCLEFGKEVVLVFLSCNGRDCLKWSNGA